jgi:hypothetical protein
MVGPRPETGCTRAPRGDPHHLSVFKPMSAATTRSGLLGPTPASTDRLGFSDLTPGPRPNPPPRGPPSSGGRWPTREHKLCRASLKERWAAHPALPGALAPHRHALARLQRLPERPGRKPGRLSAPPPPGSRPTVAALPACHPALLSLVPPRGPHGDEWSAISVSGSRARIGDPPDLRHESASVYGGEPTLQRGA